VTSRHNRGDGGPALPRIVAIADTDSYVKWAAALIGTLPGAGAGGWDASLLVLQTPLAVSETQLTAALSGSGLSDDRVERVEYERLAARLAHLQPDAVLIAARGPLVRVVARDVAAMAPRPVIVTGLPGISIPATRKAVVYRMQCDLFVLHSRRELREFADLSVRTGFAQSYALATLPFARRPEGEDAVASTDRSAATPAGSDLVFAAQAVVPAERADRLRIARLLVRAATADPGRRVVVKLRAAPGEQQTHAEQDGYPELLATLGPLPANLVTSTAPMGRALATAEGLVTVSSTAAIEAVAAGIPVIALDSFGVSPELINETLADGGLLGGEDDVVARRFRRPVPEWLDDNYFHAPQDDDWALQLATLVTQRRAGSLSPRSAVARRGGAFRDAWERRVALGRNDTSAAGTVAYAVGLPLRGIVRIRNRVRRALAGQDANAMARSAARA
jgi:hypothetical protein